MWFTAPVIFGPNISGRGYDEVGANNIAQALSACTGAFYVQHYNDIQWRTQWVGISQTGAGSISFDATKNNSLFGKSSTIQPNSYQVLMIIKT